MAYAQAPAYTYAAQVAAPAYAYAGYPTAYAAYPHVAPVAVKTA